MICGVGWFFFITNDGFLLSWLVFECLLIVFYIFGDDLWSCLVFFVTNDAVEFGCGCYVSVVCTSRTGSFHSL